MYSYNVLLVVDKEEKEHQVNEEEYSECSNSLYAAYDPFDYMYSLSECSQHSDPIYAAVVKTQTPLNSPPPLPPRNRSSADQICVSVFFVFLRCVYMSLIVSKYLFHYYDAS